MHPDESLFDSDAGSSARPAAVGSEADEAATQPIADLPLFAPADVAGETPPPADGEGDRSPSAEREPSNQHATQPVASMPSPSRDGERAVSVPVRQRLLASALDATALLVTLAVLVAISLAMGIDVEWVDLPLFLPTWLAFGFFYQVLPLLFWGRTPGMTLIGIESCDRAGGPLTLKQATLRWLAGLVTWSLAGIPGTLAFTGRSLVDRASGSRTVPSS